MKSISGPVSNPRQASAAWRWWNYVESRAPAGKTILRVNLDETSVCLYQGAVKGTVFWRKRGAPAEEEPVQRAGRAKRRTCMTHVALICDRSDIQPLLPQVVIGNCHTLLQRDWAALVATCPGNVHLVRQQSAWNNRYLCARIVRMLAAALRPYFATVQPVLLMDAVKIHFHPVVLDACHRAGIWPVMIPPKLTWLLQPCDTHAFQLYKLQLKAAYQRRRVESPTGELTVKEFLPCIYGAIRHVLQGRRWDHAFDSDGFGRNQTALSPFVQRQVQLESPLRVLHGEPSPDQLKLCLPARSRLNVATFMRPFVAPKALAAPASAVPVGVRLGTRARVALPGPSGGAALVRRAVVGGGRSASAAPAAPPGRAPRTRSEHRAAARGGAGLTHPW